MVLRGALFARCIVPPGASFRPKAGPVWLRSARLRRRRLQSRHALEPPLTKSARPVGDTEKVAQADRLNRIWIVNKRESYPFETFKGVPVTLNAVGDTRMRRVSGSDPALPDCDGWRRAASARVETPIPVAKSPSVHQTARKSLASWHGLLRFSNAMPIPSPRRPYLDRERCSRKTTTGRNQYVT
jgi:hypothetical protein